MVTRVNRLFFTVEGWFGTNGLFLQRGFKRSQFWSFLVLFGRRILGNWAEGSKIIKNGDFLAFYFRLFEAKIVIFDLLGVKMRQGAFLIVEASIGRSILAFFDDQKDSVVAWSSLIFLAPKILGWPGTSWCEKTQIFQKFFWRKIFSKNFRFFENVWFFTQGSASFLTQIRGWRRKNFQIKFENFFQIFSKNSKNVKNSQNVNFSHKGRPLWSTLVRRRQRQRQNSPMANF